MRTTLIAVSLAAGVPAMASLAAVPPRTPSGLTLEIPAEHAAVGTPFYVVTGADTQLTFISDAPFERISGTSSDIVGYIVVPDLGDAVPDTIEMVGAFRLPVASIDTGLPARNGHLQSARWLNAESFPDITFELRRARGVSVERRDDEKKITVYTATLVGDMTITDTTREMAVPARITLMEDAPRQVRGGGTLLAINCDYTVDLGEFSPGVLERNAAAIGSRVASEIELSQFLLLRPSSPDGQVQSIAGRFETTPEVAATLLRFQRLLTTSHDPDAAYAVGESLLEAAWDNAEILNIAATLAINDAAKRKDLRYALRAARRAAELTDHKDAMILDTVAAIQFESGDLAGALRTQRQAVEHLDSAPERMRGEIKANLEKYEAAQSEG
ncbi:MAG: hypothetical protein D6693_08350 [Planctomycetota bacterium]|nr:MAG: hypothetical protein D6693_08350 [Planctomycetota bacterium]